VADSLMRMVIGLQELSLERADIAHHRLDTNPASQFYRNVRKIAIMMSGSNYDNIKT